jgi:hypothetical protein
MLQSPSLRTDDHLQDRQLRHMEIFGETNWQVTSSDYLSNFLTRLMTFHDLVTTQTILGDDDDLSRPRGDPDVPRWRHFDDPDDPLWRHYDVPDDLGEGLMTTLVMTCEYLLTILHEDTDDPWWRYLYVEIVCVDDKDD